MQETTRSKLNAFARLWPLSMLLFVVLSIAAVIATMNERTNLMGAAVVASCVTFIIQLCQLVAAIIVRKWGKTIGAIFGIVVSLFVLTCSIVALAAGQYRPPVINEVSAGEDTVTFSKTEDKLSCHLTCAVPEAAVMPAVSDWLAKNFGGDYDGDKTDMQALVHYYGQHKLDFLREVYNDGVPDYAELSYEADMRTVYESDQVVTYGLTITVNLGGAHPSTIETGATFSKADGRQLTWDILRKERTTALQDHVRQMMKDYLNVQTDGELADMLQGVKDVRHIPLPTTPPYLTEDGFVLIYQQYEIGPYAMGMPTDTIPLERFKPYLTDDVQTLVSDTGTED